MYNRYIYRRLKWIAIDQSNGQKKYTGQFQAK